MENKGYNGWANYETWAVKLWLDNDEGLYNMQREMAEAVNRDKYELARAVKDFIEENNPLADTADLYTDLLNAAIGEADYYEIAEAILEDTAETVEA